MSIVFAAVKALIVEKGNVLLLKQEVQGEIFWDLPGGRVQFGESPLDGLVREAREELDREIVIGRPLGVWWFFRKADGNQVVCSTFLCRLTGDGEVRLPTEGDETIAGWQWVDPATLGDRDYASMPPSLRTLIERAVGEGI